MPSDQDEVPAGAVIAAMELVKGLGSDENAMPGGELLSLIRDAGVRPEELTQGFALLIASFMHMPDGPIDRYSRLRQPPTYARVLACRPSHSRRGESQIVAFPGHLARSIQKIASGLDVPVDHSMGECHRVTESFLRFFLAGTQLTESGLAIGISGHLTQHSGDALGERNSIIERRQ